MVTSMSLPLFSTDSLLPLPQWYTEPLPLPQWYTVPLHTTTLMNLLKMINKVFSIGEFIIFYQSGKDSRFCGLFSHNEHHSCLTTNIITETYPMFRPLAITINVNLQQQYQVFSKLLNQ